MKKVFISILLSLCMIFNAAAKDKAQDLQDTTQILESINYFDSGLFGQLDNGSDNLNYSALSIYEVNEVNVATKLKEDWIKEITDAVVAIIYNGQDSITRVTQITSRLVIYVNEYSTYVTNKIFNT